MILFTAFISSVLTFLNGEAHVLHMDYSHLNHHLNKD